jgi:hypothetical protein
MLDKSKKDLTFYSIAAISKIFSKFITDFNVSTVALGCPKLRQYQDGTNGSRQEGRDFHWNVVAVPCRQW